MIIAIADTETTGLLLPSSAPLENQPKIIELGVVLVENGEVVGTRNWMINPGEEVTAEITKITGITNDDLKDKPSFNDILSEVESVFKDCDVLIAHNAPFDVGMLENEIKRCDAESFLPKEQICSVQEYFHEYGHRPRLIQLYEDKVGKPLAQTHRASDDAMALYEALSADGFFEKIK
jgi:DNA polymerase III epsilon subunit family exonuclease